MCATCSNIINHTYEETSHKKGPELMAFSAQQEQNQKGVKQSQVHRLVKGRRVGWQGKWQCVSRSDRHWQRVTEKVRSGTARGRYLRAWLWQESWGHNSFCLSTEVYEVGQKLVDREETAPPSNKHKNTGLCPRLSYTEQAADWALWACSTSQQKACCLPLSCSLFLSLCSVSGVSFYLSVQRNETTRWGKCI